MDVDVAVLGGGPGGYPAAIRAASSVCPWHSSSRDALGGTCLNVGCIPTKALVQSAHAVEDAHDTFAQLGVKVAGVELDFGRRCRPTSRPSSTASVSGLGGLLKANGVTVVQGRGRFSGANALEVEGAEKRHVQARRDRDRLRARCARRSRASTTRAASTRPACSRRPTCRSA